jgi:hypothetical protein
MKIKSPMDFWAGLMFIAFGFFFFFAARNYQMGDAMNMGPAYFPTVLGGMLAAIGGVILFQSLVVKGEKGPAMSFPTLFFIILSLVIFGYLLELIGMVLALTVLVFLSAFAGHEFKLLEVLILSVALIIISVLVFVKGLNLPFPLWPLFLG